MRKTKLLIFLYAIPIMILACGGPAYAQTTYVYGPPPSKVCYTLSQNAAIVQALKNTKKFQDQVVSLQKQIKAYHNKICYTQAQNARIQRHLANAKAARLKIAARDRALTSLKKKIKKYARRERDRKTKIAAIDRQLIQLRKDKAAAEGRLRTTLIVSGSIVGVIVVAAAVYAITQALRPGTSQAISPLLIAPPPPARPPHVFRASVLAFR